MGRSVPTMVAAVSAVLASQSYACSIVLDERTKDQVRLESAPVELAADCSFESGGVYDNLSASGAEDLGNGRVLQRVRDFFVLVVDCSTIEATMLEGPKYAIEGDSCGPYFVHDDLVGNDAIMSMSAGATLQELVSLAVQSGATESNPTEFFNTDPWGDPMQRKDHVNLLCGCQIYYPDLPGATQ